LILSRKKDNGRDKMEEKTKKKGSGMGMMEGMGGMPDM